MPIGAILGENKAKVKKQEKERNRHDADGTSGEEQYANKIFQLSKELLRNLPQAGTSRFTEDG
jgi:hypothetical protein